MDEKATAPPPPYFEVVQHAPVQPPIVIAPPAQVQYAPVQPPIVIAPPAQVQVVYATAPVFGHHSVRLKCPRCQADVNTRVLHDPTATTHLIAVVLCFMCLLGCIPYCIDSCMVAKHRCPNCSQTIGRSSG